MRILKGIIVAAVLMVAAIGIGTGVLLSGSEEEVTATGSALPQTVEQAPEDADTTPIETEDTSVSPSQIQSNEDDKPETSDTDDTDDTKKPKPEKNPDDYLDNSEPEYENNPDDYMDNSEPEYEDEHGGNSNMEDYVEDEGLDDESSKHENKTDPTVGPSSAAAGSGEETSD